jgi:hemicentin
MILKIDFFVLMGQDGDPVQLDDRVQIVQDGIELRILNSKESDTGRYTCVARNPAGQQSLSYDLEIHGEKKIWDSYGNLSLYVE